MRLETKFDIGEKVVVPVDIKIQDTCPFCEGKGSKIIKKGNYEQTLYCQNCDAYGKIRARGSKGLTVGVITGLNYNIGPFDEDFADEYVKVVDENEGKKAHTVEYYVDVDETKFCGFGTYREQLIQKISDVDVEKVLK